MIQRDVTIEREGTYWLVHIDGTDGLTQARRFGEVETMAREYVCLVEDVPIEDVTIGTVTVQGATDVLAQANAERQQAKALDSAANRRIRDVARRLRSDSVPLAEIGQILGVSHQRAHQLVNA